MEVTKEEEKIWKDKLVEILSFFKKYCESRNLRYFCCGGTAIGVVRHQGFIPWDDDIDVYMPRPDYKKFISDFRDSNYEILSYDNTKNYCYPFAKLCDRNTTLIELEGQPYVEGLYIDIFPLDGAGSYKEFKHDKTKYAILQRALIAATTPFKFSRMWKSYKNRYYYDLTVILFYLIKPFVSIRLLKRMFYSIENKYNYDDSKNIAVYTGSYGLKEYIPKEWIGNGVDAKFENLLVKIPKDYDKYLKHFYGDYMKLPPIDKQVSHHYAFYYNLNERLSRKRMSKLLKDSKSL